MGGWTTKPLLVYQMGEVLKLYLGSYVRIKKKKKTNKKHTNKQRNKQKNIIKKKETRINTTPGIKSVKDLELSKIKK